MNAQALEQTSATPTLCVTTLKDPTSVVVLVVIRVMEETAQVNFLRKAFVIIALLRRIGDLKLEPCVGTCTALDLVLSKENTVLEHGT